MAYVLPMTTDAAATPGTSTAAARGADDDRDASPSLLEQLTRATADLDGPLAVVDLDRFDANADELLARAAGVPVRGEYTNANSISKPTVSTAFSVFSNSSSVSVGKPQIISLDSATSGIFSFI